MPQRKIDHERLKRYNRTMGFKMRFTFGDRVFYTPFEKIGVVCEIDSLAGVFVYRIKLENGDEYWAREEQIEAQSAGTKLAEHLIGYFEQDSCKFYESLSDAALEMGLEEGEQIELVPIYEQPERLAIYKVIDGELRSVE